jgi:hypothetical protein
VNVWRRALLTGGRCADSIVSHTFTADVEKPAPPAVVVREAPAVFLRTTFQIIASPAAGNAIVGDNGAPVRLQECSFSQISATHPLGSTAGALFFSDNQTLSIGDDEGNAIGFPQPLSAGDGVYDFPTTQDPFFVNTREVRLEECTVNW